MLKTMEFPLHLEKNENRFGPAPECIDKLRALPADLLSQYTRRTTPEDNPLVQRLGRIHGLDTGQIGLANGSEDLLMNIFHHFLARNSRVLLPAHSWWYYRKLASDTGARVIEYPAMKSGDRFHFDVHSILAMTADHRPHLVLIASPDNPLGYSYSETELHTLLRRLTDTVVVLDRAYDGFGRTTELEDGMLVKTYPNLIVSRTFSKFYALAGLRIGYGLIGKFLTDFLPRTHRYLGFNRISETAALAALDSRIYYEHIRENLAAERERFHGRGTFPEEFRIYRSETNFVMVEFPAELKDTLKNFLEEHGILVKFFSDPFLENFMRITIGTGAENSYFFGAIRRFARDHRPATIIP